MGTLRLRAQEPSLVIMGGHRLQGEVTVSGAKNAALPILAATMLTGEPCTVRRIPANADVQALCEIMRGIGVRTRASEPRAIVTDAAGDLDHQPDEELVSALRGSICLLGPLLARCGRARLALPGGCTIGPRPVDLHLKALRALGAKVRVQHGHIVADAPRGLRGARMYLGGNFGPSVLATANAAMAAVLARGRTTIEHAAVEPEVEDLLLFLQAMGAEIRGIGSHRLVIDGVEELHGADYAIVPDRIEAGTFMMAAAATGGDVLIRGMRDDHLDAALDRLNAGGTRLSAEADGLRVSCDSRPRAVDVTALPYPGFPTDLQAPFVALQCVSEGSSVICDKVFPKRFRHAEELARMGADVKFEDSAVRVRGVDRLTGARVQATDLRAAAALIIAGLSAEGVTKIQGLHHLERGYEDFAMKLQGLGARIQRVEPTVVRMAG